MQKENTGITKIVSNNTWWWPSNGWSVTEGGIYQSLQQGILKYCYQYAIYKLAKLFSTGLNF